MTDSEGRLSETEGQRLAIMVAAELATRWIAEEVRAGALRRGEKLAKLAEKLQPGPLRSYLVVASRDVLRIAAAADDALEVLMSADVVDLVGSILDREEG